jgi:predicted esterase
MLLLLGSVIFSGQMILPMLVVVLLKELTNGVDTTMKSTFGPCGILLWCMEDSAPQFVLLCAAVYAGWLYYQGQEVEPITTDAIGAASDKSPTIGIVWLHGLGDTSRGVRSLARTLSFPEPTHWVFPAAPIQQVSADWGLPRRAWFDIATAPLRVGLCDDERGIQASVDVVHEAIRELESIGIKPNRIAVGGLSQGGALAMASALTYPKRLAGAVCLGGWLPSCVPLTLESSADAAKRPQEAGSKSRASDLCPVYWQHGARDDCVLPEVHLDGVKRLKAAGVDVISVRDKEAGHIPGVEQIMGVQKWLQQVLSDRCR